MKTLLKSQYLELKNAEKNKLMNVYDSTITISDDEYNCLMQYADGKEIIVIDDSTPINPTPIEPEQNNLFEFYLETNKYSSNVRVEYNGIDSDEIVLRDNTGSGVYGKGGHIMGPYIRTNEIQHIIIYAYSEKFNVTETFEFDLDILPDEENSQQFLSSEFFNIIYEGECSLGNQDMYFYYTQIKCKFVDENNINIILYDFKNNKWNDCTYQYKIINNKICIGGILYYEPNGPAYQLEISDYNITNKQFTGNLSDSNIKWNCIINLNSTDELNFDVYDYTGCDFGINEWGYNIISMENNINTVSIKYRGNQSVNEIVIPENIEYNGKTFIVTNLGQDCEYSSTSEKYYIAFFNCGAEHIIIPNTIKYISIGAFVGCSNLTNITIPASVISIGHSEFRKCFEACINLTSIIVNSNNIVYDSRNNCNAIIETTTNKLIKGCINTIIPDSVTTIDDMAFYGCTGLTNIIIPDSVTTIGDRAFDGCRSLTSITIPDSVTTIGDRAFNGCWFKSDSFINNSNLNAQEHDYWGATIYDYNIDGMLIKDNVLIKYIGSSQNVIIANNIERIAHMAFSYNLTIQNVIIQNNVKYIEDGAFSNCTNLIKINIPNSVIQLGSWNGPVMEISIFNGIFRDCDNLKTIILDCLHVSGDLLGDVYSNKNIKNIIIESSVQSVKFNKYVYSPSIYEQTSKNINMIIYSSPSIFDDESDIFVQLIKEKYFTLYVADELFDEYNNVYEKEIFLNQIQILPISQFPEELNI